MFRKKKHLTIHLTDLSYVIASAVIIIITVLLFLDRAVFRKLLPIVFLGGAYLTIVNRRRLKVYGEGKKWSAPLSVFYDVIILTLGLFFLVSCLTNWI